MGDAFEPRLCNLYVQFFGRLLQNCRALPSADWLDRRLRYFGLSTEQDLMRRARAIRQAAKVRADRSAVQKVLVLSRVTLGAEVAITSVVLQRMMRAYPAARLVLLANHKAALLFAGESRVTVHPVEYPRGGGLLDRLAAWPAVVEAVEEELDGLHPGQYLVVDPDSRFTQLGLLPVVADESAYRFFESRSFSRPGLETLAELTAAWLGEVFGPDSATLHPWVSLPPEAMQFARAVTASSLGGRWASMNLGVGDNPRKRLDDPFEQHVLAELLASGWRVFLDKGEGQEETGRVDRLRSRLRETGRRVAEIVERGDLPPPGAEVVAWQGSLAGFGALIGVSDLYIGYDSAGGHIAAAQGVKTVDIFAGFRSPRMPQRWRPSGPGEVRQIVVDPDSAVDPEKILAAVLEAAR
jgi:ADP-heptose:LPS heptosyltransferase